MKNIFSKAGYHRIKNLIVSHKISSAIVAVIVIFGGYQVYKNMTSTATETKYVVGVAQKGTVISTVTGTGQVSASGQIDLKSNASGNLLYIGLADGKQLKAGDLIAQIDSKDASISLQNAQLSLAKLVEPADAVTMTQAQNDLANAVQSNKQASDTLNSSYTGALGSISSTFIDIPAIIDGMNTIFYTSSGTLNDVDSVNLPGAAKEYKGEAGTNFDLAKNKYLANLSDYKSVNSNSATSTIENLIKETLDTTQLLTTAVQGTKTTLDYTQNLGGGQTLKNMATTQANLNTWLGKLTGHVSDLTNIYNTIQNSKNTVVSSASDIIAKTQALRKLQSGTDPLDVQQQQLAVRTQEYNYENYFIRAPFAGMIAKTNVNKGDYIGGGTTIATFITEDKVAEITLNEVDASKVKVGQRATLTFDAIDGLSLTGHVVEVDLSGVVTQGVVTYGVKIALDTQDSRVLSGMSVSATVQTDVHTDVVVVPNTAIKSQGSTKYILGVDNSVSVSTNNTGDVLATAPQQKIVSVGISDDQNTEILSGVSDGDKVVIKTIAGTATTATAAPSLLNSLGAGGRGGVGGGAARAATGR